MMERLQGFAMQPFEVLVPRRPVSLQTKSRKNLRAWKAFVRSVATIAWENRGAPVSFPALRCTIVYLCDASPADIDNIIKPIQDSLVGIVFNDDSLLSDVDSHRRFLGHPIDVTSFPPLLLNGVAGGIECVYVRVSDATELRSYL
jgi:crossover junction endodeoxyribonuclease RusA